MEQNKTKNQHQSTVNIPDKLQLTLRHMLTASEYAADTQSDVWDFAVSIEQLLKKGATETQLRWLVCKGLIQQRHETTAIGDASRQFQISPNLNFSPQTCFVLTESGILAARRQFSHLELSKSKDTNFHCADNGNQVVNRDTIVHVHNGHLSHKSDSISTFDLTRHDSIHDTNSVPPAFLNRNGQSTDSQIATLPHWDPNARALSFDGQLVKGFRWRAVNQEALLSAFQEEGWPVRIDDPLPPKPEQCPKRRLADTIKCLNRKQTTPLIHFRGDGTGQGVLWEQIG